MATSSVEGRERTDEGAPPSITIMDESSRSMAEHMIQAIGDRFERRLTEEISRVDGRLTEEISGLRVEMHEGFGGLRAEMHDGDSALRAEMHEGFVELRDAISASGERVTRWMLLLWIGQLGALGGLLAYLK